MDPLNLKSKVASDPSSTLSTDISFQKNFTLKITWILNTRWEILKFYFWLNLFVSLLCQEEANIIIFMRTLRLSLSPREMTHSSDKTERDLCCSKCRDDNNNMPNGEGIIIQTLIRWPDPIWKYWEMAVGRWEDIASVIIGLLSSL